MANQNEILKVLERLSPFAAEAVASGGDWDGGDGEPYRLIHGGETKSAMGHELAEVVNDRFFVDKGYLRHEILAFVNGVVSWREERDVGSPTYADLLDITRFGALRRADAYLRHAVRDGYDPLSLITPPLLWEFELGERPDSKYRYLVTRARPIGRSAWYASKGLPAAVKGVLGVAPMISSGVISAYGQNNGLEELHDWLETEGVVWTSETSGVVPVKGGAPPQVVREAAKGVKAEDLVRVE